MACELEKSTTGRPLLSISSLASHRLASNLFFWRAPQRARPVRARAHFRNKTTDFIHVIVKRGNCMPCASAHVAIFLTVTACNIIFGAVFAWIGKDIRCFAKFNQMTQMEKGGALRNARGLLHIVGHDDDGVFSAQIVN